MNQGKNHNEPFHCGREDPDSPCRAPANDRSNVSNPSKLRTKTIQTNHESVNLTGWACWNEQPRTHNTHTLIAQTPPVDPIHQSIAPIHPKQAYVLSTNSIHNSSRRTYLLRSYTSIYPSIHPSIHPPTHPPIDPSSHRPAPALPIRATTHPPNLPST